MRKCVLIVDDDPAVRQSIGRVLDAAGYEVVSSANGHAATERFAAGRIDLVLLDLNLPQENGWEVFGRLTSQDPFVPIVIITGLSDQYLTARAAGVNVLMEKPIDAPVLLQTIQDLLSDRDKESLRRIYGLQPETRHVPPFPETGEGHPREVTPPKWGINE